MKKWISYLISLLLLGGLVYFGWYTHSIYADNTDIAQKAAIEQAEAFVDLYRGGMELSTLVKAGGGTRITVIDSDGMILADSRPIDMSSLESRLNRPEIQAALNNSPTTIARFSNTLESNFMYYALKVETLTDSNDYVFIRAAVPVAQVSSPLFQALQLAILILVVAAILGNVIIQGINERKREIKRKF
ncbi:MAG: hypothetical protein FWH07_05745 [Oscillospiraceae bacterium]|nr:hypothetical protein [Oscillospiraceae bacterium]